MDYIRKTLIVSFIFSIFFLATLQLNNLISNSNKNKKVLGVTSKSNTTLCGLLESLTDKYCPNLNISTTNPTYNIGQTNSIYNVGQTRNVLEQASIDNIVAISDSDGKSATIMFTTNKQVVSKIEYGTTASNLVLMAVDDVSTSGHQIILSSLRPNTSYYYRIRIDGRIFDNNGIPYMFKTKGQTVNNSSSDTLSISNISVIPSSDGKSATIKFITSTPITAKLEYSTNSAVMTLMTVESKPTENHQIILNTLRTNTNYYYRIRIGDKIFDNNGIPYMFRTRGQ